MAAETKQPNQQDLMTLMEKYGLEIRRRIAAEIPAVYRSLLDADDVMQETYTDAFLAADRDHLPQIRAFRAWLHKIAECNLRDALKHLDAYKRGEVRQRRDLHSQGDSYNVLYEELVPDSRSYGGKTPSNENILNERRKAVMAAVNRLPDPHRTVILLYDIEERSIDEVALNIGRSVGATYMIRYRALEMLREILGSGSRF